MYSEFVASFGIPRDKIEKFELLIGFHPRERRFLNEREERLSLNFIKFVDQSTLNEKDYRRDYEKIAKLHLEVFPELKCDHGSEDIIQTLWKKYIDYFDIFELGYICPKDFANTYRVENDEEIAKKNNELRQVLEKRTNAKLKGTGKIAWTLNFPANGFLGRLIETKHGISKYIKENYSLLEYPSGIIARFLMEQEISTILSPSQFEEVVGKLFEYEGWSIKFTQKTRDGGKDIVASKMDLEGNKHVAYIEAKRHSRKNKVGIGITKQFFATVLVDNVKGFLVTSSLFTKPAQSFIDDNQICTTHIELYDRRWLAMKVNEIAERDLSPFLAN